ncbi:MAG: 3-beta hydroxysteroid [Geobacteraceae bacterium]|nr:MAG: 3-beta hydroxysteroid [Geobacteraceae bacterium]
MDRVLIIGCGYVGKRVAKLAMEKNASVVAMARAAKSFEELEKLGIQTVSGDLDYPPSLRNLPTKGALVFYFAPPPGGGLTDPRMRSFCTSVAPGDEPHKVVYMSTSGVYGDCGGSAVTEETPPHPQTTRAKRRLDAEAFLLSWGNERNAPVVILRVAGIYGPGRLPIPHIESGNPVLYEHEAPFTNRIHADDLARVCIAAADKGEAGDIFNVSDGESGTMTHYFNAVADAFGLMRPPQVSMKEAREVMNPLILSYFSESRQMDNGKMREKLGIGLLYPTLGEGLKASRTPD